MTGGNLFSDRIMVDTISEKRFQVDKHPSPILSVTFSCTEGYFVANTNV